MAYQTGVFTSPKDLLQKLDAFVTGLGVGLKWTKDLGADDGVGGVGWRLHLHKGGVYVHMRASLSGEAVGAFFEDAALGHGNGNSAILIYGGEGFDSAASWRRQPNSILGNGVSFVVGAGCLLNTGAGTAYHFFADASGDNLICVVERIPGIFGYFGFGTSVDKTGAGSWAGGAYFFGTVNNYYVGYNIAQGGTGYNLTAVCPFSQFTHANAFVRANVDAFTGKWLDLGEANAWYYGWTGKTFNCCAVSNAEPGQTAPSYTLLQNRLTCSMNGQSLMLPLRFTVPRDAGGHSFLGQLPNIYYCNATAHGFTPGALYTWGLRQFRIFPNFAVEQV